MRKFAALGTTVLLSVAAACDDDSPSTNTDDSPSMNSGEGSISPTGPTQGNVGDITASTPVAAGDDSVVQGNQPMQTSTED